MHEIVASRRVALNAKLESWKAAVDYFGSIVKIELTNSTVSYLLRLFNGSNNMLKMDL